MYIASTVLLFALGWFSHLIIRGEDTASDHCKNCDQDSKHTMPAPNRHIELQTLKHKIIGARTNQRDITDRRYCVWTDNQGGSMKILKEFGIDVSEVQLGKGEVLAVFMNDMFTEVLMQIVHNKSAGRTFADYADSGMTADMPNPQEGKKYTRATAVVFTPINNPSYLGMRSMVQAGLSEKQ
jgi:hypothetical protein